MDPQATPAWLTPIAERPAVVIALTLVSYAIAQALQSRFPRNPFLNPTLVAVVLVVLAIELAGVPYDTYLRGAQIINFLLAPTVVVLAVPLFRRLSLVRESWAIIVAAVLLGMPAGVISTIGLATLCGAQASTVLSLAPKSVTTGIAIGISDAIGGIPPLTAVFVIVTGIVGAVLGPRLLQALNVRDDRIIGLAIGIGSHGIGTARAFQIGEVTGAFASLAMALNGVLTATLLPIIFAKH